MSKVATVTSTIACGLVAPENYGDAWPPPNALSSPAPAGFPNCTLQNGYTGVNDHYWNFQSFAIGKRSDGSTWCDFYYSTAKSVIKRANGSGNPGWVYYDRACEIDNVPNSKP